MKVKLLKNYIDKDDRGVLVLRVDVDIEVLMRVIENNGREKATSIIGDLFFTELEKEIIIDE